MSKTFEDILAEMPDEIQLLDPAGNPIEDCLIPLDRQTKENLAHIVFETGDDLETVIIETLQGAVETYNSTLDSEPSA